MLSPRDEGSHIVAFTYVFFGCSTERRSIVYEVQIVNKTGNLVVSEIGNLVANEIGNRVVNNTTESGGRVGGVGERYKKPDKKDVERFHHDEEDDFCFCFAFSIGSSLDL